MELRWHQTYNKHGLKTEPTLQYRESDDEKWKEVRLVCVPEHLVDDVE